MSSELSNFLFELANFGLLAAALGWFFFKPIRGVIAAEQTRMHERQDELKELVAKLEANTRKLEEDRKSHDETLEAQRQEQLREAQLEAERIREAASRAAEARHAQLALELEEARAAQIPEFANLLGEVAQASLRRLLDTIKGPDLDLALVRAACDELDRSAPGLSEKVVVEHASPLSADSAAILDRSLLSGYELRLAPDLLAGVRITTSAGQVDATAAGIARHAATDIAASLTERNSPP